MGMFGSRSNMSAAQQVSRGGDGMDPATARPSFFGEGGTGRGIAGNIGDALLSLSGRAPMYAPMMAQNNQQIAMLQRQMQIEQYKRQNPEPTDIMREAQSMNLQQGTPQYNKFISDWRMKQPMIVLGNPESGQTVINPMQAGGAPNPPPSVGEVQDGHRYNGGDPGDPASWSPL